MLARRFVLYLLLPLLLLFVVSEAAIYLVTRDHLQEQIDAILQSRVEAIDEAITTRVGSIERDLATMQAYRERTQYYQYLAFDQHDKAHRELIALEHNLASVAALKPRCSAFRLLDLRGKTIINIVDGKRDYIEHNASKERWFRGTLALPSGASRVSAVHVSEAGGCETITVSAPSSFRGRVLGAVAIDICVEDLVADLIRDQVPGGGYALVVGPAGDVLAEIGDAPLSGNGRLAAMVDRMAEGYAGIHSFDGAEGEQTREVFRPQNATGLGVVIGVPHSKILAPIDRMRATVVPLTIAGFLLITIIGLVMVQRTVRPIRRLTAAAGEIAMGDLDRTLDVSTGDEIQILAQSFNRMTESLRESQRETEGALAKAQASAETEQEKAAELGRAYDELKAAQKQLVQAEKMGALGQLAGGIAHDFNNLLSGIMSCADLLKRVDLEPEKHATYLDTILETSRRAADLVRQLMAFSRSGPAQLVRVNLHVLLREASAILRRTVDRRIKIEERFDAAVADITGDPSQLQSALLNLCVNARDAMPEGGVLTLATRMLGVDEAFGATFPEPLEPGNYIEVSVADTGRGMEPETMARIFEPFFTTKEVGAGTGLGLSAVYGTVRSHHGAVRVYSEPDEGSIFRIYLPVAGVGGETWQKPPPAAVIHGTGRILLVDDESVIRALGVDMLEWLGYEVTAAEDGVAALACYRDGDVTFDLVIADLVMPRMNGRDLLRELRRLDPDVRVLIASGFLPNVQEHELRAEGAADVLEKPYMVADLSRRVASCLAAHGETRRLRVLVVDDTRVNREAIGALLEGLGHTVVRAVHAEEGLERLSEQAFDVLLLDLGLPGMSGLEAAQVIRAREGPSSARLPIVAITGEGTPGSREDCVGAGMDDFLAKPIELASLRAALGRVMRTAPSSIDWEGACEALGGQTKLLLTVAEIFLEESPAMLESLGVAVERADAAEICLRAHALKGAMLYFRGHPARRHAEALEAQGRDGALAESAEALAALERGYASLREEIRVFLQRESPAPTVER